MVPLKISHEAAVNISARAAMSASKVLHSHAWLLAGGLSSLLSSLNLLIQGWLCVLIIWQLDFSKVIQEKARQESQYHVWPSLGSHHYFLWVTQISSILCVREPHECGNTRRQGSCRPSLGLITITIKFW